MNIKKIGRYILLKDGGKPGEKSRKTVVNNDIVNVIYRCIFKTEPTMATKR